MITRREFVSGCARAAAGCALQADDQAPGAEGKALAIVDTHTHFYDPRRPGGVPWPPESDKLLYRPVLPADYLALARPLGIVGTVVVEASPRVADNDWLLELAAQER